MSRRSGASAGWRVIPPRPGRAGVPMRRRRRDGGPACLAALSFSESGRGLPHSKAAELRSRRAAGSGPLRASGRSGGRAKGAVVGATAVRRPRPAGRRAQGRFGRRPKRRGRARALAKLSRGSPSLPPTRVISARASSSPSALGRTRGRVALPLLRRRSGGAPVPPGGGLRPLRSADEAARGGGPPSRRRRRIGTPAAPRRGGPTHQPAAGPGRVRAGAFLASRGYSERRAEGSAARWAGPVVARAFRGYPRGWPPGYPASGRPAGRRARGRFGRRPKRPERARPIGRPARRGLFFPRRESFSPSLPSRQRFGADPRTGRATTAPPSQRRSSGPAGQRARGPCGRWFACRRRSAVMCAVMSAKHNLAP